MTDRLAIHRLLMPSVQSKLDRCCKTKVVSNSEYVSRCFGRSVNAGQVVNIGLAILVLGRRLQ